MNHISFAPYVGPRYRQSPVRLLLVGESHYGELGPEDDPWEVTRTVVRKWQSREWAIRYLTVAGRILSGKQAWEVDREQVFAQAAFYNFVQFVMPTVRHRPTADQGRRSWPAFREVLERWDPTHVLATGPGYLWSNMPPSDFGASPAGLAGMHLHGRQYATPSGRAAAMVIPHLSRASAPRWQAPVAEFLSRAGG